MITSPRVKKIGANEIWNTVKGGIADNARLI